MPSLLRHGLVLSPTEAGLLADIIANPDNDSLRLVLADWLEDAGQEERAEFIRVQIELARWRATRCYRQELSALPVQPCGVCTFCRLYRRAAELLEHGHCPPPWCPDVWQRCIAPVPDDWPGAPSPSCYYRRGFVESIVCDWEWWELHHEEILVCQPVRRVYLTTGPGIVETFPNPGWFSPINGLAARWPGLKFDLHQPNVVPNADLLI